MTITSNVRKIISGGQTGADRAALDFAVLKDIPYDGWISKGRLTEEGPLNPKYHLQETASGRYEERTERNVMEADGTLIFCREELSGGSLFTLLAAQKHGRPVLVIRLAGNGSQETSQAETRKWLKRNRIEILNVAGPRASKDPGIYGDVFQFLENLFSDLGIKEGLF